MTSKSNRAKGEKSQRLKIPNELQEQRETLIEEEDLGIEAPEEFEELYGERVVGWFLPAAGNILQGVIKDSFQKESNFHRRGEEPKKQTVFKIQVTAVNEKRPTIVIPSDPENDDESVNGVYAQVDDLVGLDQKGFLSSLSKCVVGQEVWIACLGKLPPSAEYPQGAWKYKVLAVPATNVDPVTGEVTSKSPTKSGGKAA
jgi:hypothetical protein